MVNAERTASPRARARRARPRSRRGATVFVVMLVIASLSAAGLFAARASLSAVETAGRHRQMVQTQIVSELGMALTVSELARDPQYYKNSLFDDSGPQGLNRSCRKATKARPQCVRIGYQQIGVISGLTNVVEPKSGGAPGGLGFGDVRANFASEVVDAVQGPPAPRWAASSSITSTMAFFRFTLATTGQVVPDSVAVTDANEDTKHAASTSETRAYVVIGPLR